MGKCNINSTEINFIDPKIMPVQIISRWMKFCKTLYIDKCSIQSLRPPLYNISYMESQATHEDCLSTRQLTAYCISMIFSILIIIANLIILAAFVRDRRHLMKISNLPVISLAFSDLLTGLTFLYSTTWNIIIINTGYDFDINKTQYFVNKRSNYYLCLTLDGPGSVFACMMSSVLSLGIIAVERYIAVFHSYSYLNWITKRRMTFAIIALWLISILVSILPLCGWNNWQGICQLTKVMHYGYLVLWSTICFVCGLIILFIYLRIFAVARRHSRQIESQVSSTTSTYSLPSETETTSSSDRKLSKARNEKFQMKNMSKSNTEKTKETSFAESQESKAPYIKEEISPTDQADTDDNNAIPKNDLTKSNKPTRKSVSVVDPKYKNVSKPRSKRLFQRPSMKAIRTTAMILGAFYLCWTPLLVYLLAFRDRYDNLYVYYLAVVTQLNSLFNPIMYGFRQSDIKKALKKLIPCNGCHSNI